MNDINALFESMMSRLESLGSERIKKTYIRRGAREPVFGVTIKDMKPLMKETGTNQALAELLYSTGNYDAMYFAGMISDVTSMTEADFERWMDGAYFYMISDYTIAIMLTEAPFAQEKALSWIDSGDELRASAGWSAFAWLLGVKNDDYFDIDLIRKLLGRLGKIHECPNRERYSMNLFLSAVGISYKPLHDEAVQIAAKIGAINVDMGDTSCQVPIALDYINKAVNSGRLGFKRKHVRC